MPDHTIYDNLIKDENSLTEALRNNLKIKSFRDVFLDNMGIDWIDNDSISFEDIETQVRIGIHGQPDLVIRTKDIEILIEIKVYDTQTTSNQPNGYLAYLNTIDRNFKALVFLVPDGYFQIREIKMKLEENRDNCDSSIVTWNSLINLINRKELAAFNSLLTEFQTFLANWFLPTKQIFTQNNTNCMFSKDFGESLEKTLRLIDNIEDDLKKRGYKVKNSRKKYFEEYGFYIDNMEGETLLFFGLWLEYWKTTGSPLIIGLESKLSGINKEFQKLDDISGLRYLSFDYEGEDYETVYLEKEIVESEKNEKTIIDAISTFLENEKMLNKT